MSCMCGDPMCPFCGPAQGYDPTYEAVCDLISEACPALDKLEDPSDIIEQIAVLLNKQLEKQLRDITKWIGSLAKSRPSIISVRPPIIENMSKEQVIAHIVERLEDDPTWYLPSSEED